MTCLLDSFMSRSSECARDFKFNLSGRKPAEQMQILTLMLQNGLRIYLQRQMF